LELGSTPSQTIGPFFAILLPLADNALAARHTAGAIVIEGRVFDGAGECVPDAMIEVWQADAAGVYAHPEDDRYVTGKKRRAFTGFGRCFTGADGWFSFVTVKPGRIPGFDERMQAPHLSVSVFARGLLRRLATRMYFPDETTANAIDPLLSSIEDEAVRRTLIAEAIGAFRLRFDIRLQGEGETAFLAV